MAECGVCYEIYEKEGIRCPKLLPCGHSLCFSCLSQTLKHGYIKCPFCRMGLQILSGDAGNFPTNEQIFTQNTRSCAERKKINTNNISCENKNKYALPPAAESPWIPCPDTRTCKFHRNHKRGACPLHREPFTQVTFGGAQQRVCKSCLDPNFVVLTVPETADHPYTRDNNQTNREVRRNLRLNQLQFRIMNDEMTRNDTQNENEHNNDEQNDNEQNRIYQRHYRNCVIGCCCFCFMIITVVLIFVLIFRYGLSY